MSVPGLNAKSFIWDESYHLLDAFPAGVVVCDHQGNIVTCNSELLSMFGYSSEELIGKSVEILIPSPHSQGHDKLLQTYMKNPEKRSMGNDRTLYAKHKNKRNFPVEVGLNPIDTGAARQVIATVVDISHRVRVENNFKNVVNAAPVGMLIVKPDGTIMHCNQQLLNIFGYTESELFDQPLETLIPQRHKKQHVGYRQAYLINPATRSMGLDRDLTGVHKSGTEIPVEIGLNPIETDDGIAIIAAVIDITERKKAELKLRQMNADLDEFTYVASHDLKSPLRGISNLVEWIEEDLEQLDNDDVKNNLERIKVRIDRMEKLINDLLSYAKSGTHNGSITTVHLDKLIENVLEVINIPDGFNVTVNGFQGAIQSARTPLETVLRNLVSNAIKHHDKESGEIQINIEQEDAYCRFDIKDDGPGIPSNAHERVFKLFQSLDNSSEERSGVGLAVVKRMVESGNGTIEIISNDGERGCCFRFWWPCVARRDIDEY